MQKHLSQSDFYSRLAKQEDYPSRSVYKLKEIDQKFDLIKKNDRVLDLGCSPGAWLKYISTKIGEQGQVIGVDIDDLKVNLGPNMVFIQKDILGADIFLLPELQEDFQVVVSDLAPHTSGLKEKDAAESLTLAGRAWEIAQKVLAEGGHLVAKIFEGAGVDEFIRELKPRFQTVKRFRPKAVRKESPEFYLVAQGFKRF